MSFILCAYFSLISNVFVFSVYYYSLWLYRIIKNKQLFARYMSAFAVFHIIPCCLGEIKLVFSQLSSKAKKIKVNPSPSIDSDFPGALLTQRGNHNNANVSLGSRMHYVHFI